MTTGIDIVQQQIRVARGERLALSQAEIGCSGHAIECRINAENPETFAPSPGLITGWELPGEPELNLLFETHEYARFANRMIWPAVAVVMDQVNWGFEELAEVERWFERFEPVLPVGAGQAVGDG